MAENFQDNVVYSVSTLAVSGDAVAIGSTNAGAKSVIFASSNTQGHLAWAPTANRTINLPDAAGTVMLTSQAILSISAGAARITSGEVVFSNSNGLAFGANGQTITGSYTVPSIAGLISNVNLSAGTTSNNLSAFVFSNSNNVSFGLNGSTVTATISVPAQTAQSVGVYAVSNTTGASSSSTVDARSISFQGAGIASVGMTNGSVVISVPSGGAASVNLSAGTTSNNLTAFVFSNSNNVSFGLNGSTVTATISVPAQTVQTVGLYGVGNTTQNSSTTLDARTISFDGLGAASVGFSNGSVQISVPAVVAQTVQTVGLYGLGNTTQNSSTTLDARTLSFNGIGGITVGYSNGSIQLSGPQTVAQTAQTVGLYGLGNTTQNSSTTLDARTLSFNGLGIVTVGYSNGSIQVSATQSAQSIGFYAVSNTTQNSSTTLDARTLSFQGAGIASVGYSNGSIVVSVPSGAPSPVNFSAGTTSGNLGSVVFSNSNGVSFGLNGSTITASAAGGGGAQSLYALGNTTQNSSTTLSSLSFNALGAMTWGYSNGSIQVSAPATSSLIATGLVSISTNGSTISIGAAERTWSVWEPYPEYYLTGSVTASHSGASAWFDKVELPNVLAVSYINVIKSMSGAGPTASTGTWKQSYAHSISIFSRQDYGANSTNMSYVTSCSIGISGGATFNSVTAQSFALSWVTNSTGGTTSFSTTSSNSGWVSFMTGLKMWRIPLVTTLTAGEYFVGQQQGSTSSTTNVNSALFSFSNFALLGQASGLTIGTITSSGSIVSSNFAGQGFGMISSGGLVTNATMALSGISVQTNSSAGNRWYMNFSNI